MKRLILASSSPRRKELLSMNLLSYEVIPSTIQEVMDPSFSPEELVCSLARQKAEDVFRLYPDHVVLGADTIVVNNGTVLGKPAGRKEAIDVLRSLSGRTHTVYTGVSILAKEREQIFFVSTDVTFWELSDAEIENYVNSGEPFDKAGSYGIQGLGARLVQSIAGDFYSVVGLPVSRVVRELESFGISAVSQEDEK
ncbi:MULTISPECIES: Maf family protein [Fictibacillus]|uniref:dTTP/UTP pyrophosphatase n=1 Tax=Fictibacillus enclensis TaxID=1017270 RepID=A0A0V8JAB5_9BACL|nr:MULTISPECIES: Maf family protein [Fictibacillus]KSU83768.1 septum formation protein Maf [Fictibacillus enclensis]MDM5199955.1 Maf family protein [Fictibacillus enclensis]RXY98283.1 septum formation inhibitor Maf [Fictibacillus sp. S7]WHY70721.1 Maf family protein [Fictibacillus enclensis]SCC20846.1 septum formation protein [Fictibacillus enclensis]